MVINYLSCPRDTASVAPTLIHSDGLVVNSATGDILGYDSKPSVFSLAITYTKPKHNSAHSYESRWLLDPADDLDLADDLISTLVDEDEAEPTSSGSGRGRKPNMFDNKVSRHVQVASEVNAPWP
jgi:hypothetical protein